MHVISAAGARPGLSGIRVLALALMLPLALPQPSEARAPLNPLTLQKYVDPLPVPGVMPPVMPGYYEIGMYAVTQQLHRDLPPTSLYGYGTSAATASYPAATIEARRDEPFDVLWTNNLPMSHLLGDAIDTTLHMAHAMHGVPAVVHVHGAEVEPESDGGPDAWFTPGFTETGPGWRKSVYHYVNTQLPTTLFYHDHALGITRLNVYAGLAGFFLIRDPAIEAPLNLPSGDYEIPLAIQDRMFWDDGQLLYPVGGDNPEIHPLWQPEFFGNTVLVNGKVWPYLDVEPRKYRFRVLNGSNARFYALRLYEDGTGMPGPVFWQIGSDGGYLDAPVPLNSPVDPRARRLVMAPGERADVVIDFSDYAPGTTLTLQNNARSPFPNGEPADPRTVGRIMQFRIIPSTGPDLSSIATPGPGYVSRLDNPARTRQLTLDEIMGQEGPIAALLNASEWDDPATETPELGSTEVWQIINTTGDAHPIHLHLVQYQLISRQRFQANRYEQDRMSHENGMDPVPIDVTRYLIGRPKGPLPEEAGWKDTFQMFPGEVTTVIARFAPQDGDGAYEFDATNEPGYVWHCHILEHEDNEMMRPLLLQASSQDGPVPAAEAAPAPGAFPILVSGNPVRGAAIFHYRVAASGPVVIRLFAVDGRLLRTLVDEAREPGEYQVPWDGRDASGSPLPAGVYFLQGQSATAKASVRLVISR